MKEAEAMIDKVLALLNSIFNTIATNFLVVSLHRFQCLQDLFWDNSLAEVDHSIK